jgi:hypothetical protein
MIGNEYENDNLQNISCILTVIIFIFLTLKQNLTLFKDFKM